jgi:glycine cleavage system H protein
MEEFLEVAFDKFIFRAKVGYLYSKDEFWADVQGGVVTVGLTDFLQKSMGDVTFLETVGSGTQVERGQEIGTIETMKVAFGLISPITGTVLEVNPELELRPERINNDPYGAGWIYRIELVRPEDLAELLPADRYLELLKEKIEEEAKGL